MCNDNQFISNNNRDWCMQERTEKLKWEWKFTFGTAQCRELNRPQTSKDQSGLYLYILLCHSTRSWRKMDFSQHLQVLFWSKFLVSTNFFPKLEILNIIQILLSGNISSFFSLAKLASLPTESKASTSQQPKPVESLMFKMLPGVLGDRWNLQVCFWLSPDAACH